MTANPPRGVYRPMSASSLSIGSKRLNWPRLAQLGATHAALIGIGALFFLPHFWLVTSSLQPDAQLHTGPPRWLPSPITFEHYVKGLQFIDFATMLRNTLVVAGLSVIGTVISCSLVAYSLAVLQWRGRDLLFYILLSTMMLPG